MRLLSRLDLHQRLSPRAYRLLPLDCTHKHNAEQCSRAAQNHITYQINNSNRSKELIANTNKNIARSLHCLAH